VLGRAISTILPRLFRGAFLARRRLAPHTRTSAPARGKAKSGARSILFITSDQQRYDALGVNGGRVARTPRLDRLAAAGVNFQRAHVQNVVCMPSRSTMLTGQHPRTHGVIANGIALPDDAPSVAAYLRERAGYHTALIGKAHFDPHLDPWLRFAENRRAAERRDDVWHGFEHLELATHGPMGGHHYAAWLWEHHPDDIRGFGGVLSGTGGGDTGAPEVVHNPIERSHYHTDWVADRTIAWLSSLSAEQPFFCWLSFPDPHHPFDPPAQQVRERLDWRALDLPEGHPRSRHAIEAILSQKPRHWLDWYQGRFRNPEGGPIEFSPAALSHDQVREMNAMIHVENELIDEAIGRVLDCLRERGRDADTDVLYTSDHGELQGDFGLAFKGPYHVEALMHVPLVWRPAPTATLAPAVVTEPVGLVDLAPTFCRIAGLEVPDWMEGVPLPTAPGSDRSHVLTTFDSQFAAVGMHLRTIYADGHICTVYEPRTQHEGGSFPFYWSLWGRGSRIPDYDGSEGELYDTREDPHQWHNLWDDPSRRSLRDGLVGELRDQLPPLGLRLPVAAPT
jgi:arylsulfatase A-like enzyme